MTRHEVTDADTAVALGSGDVPVLATPRLIAWLETATVGVAGPFLEPGQTTVGIEIRVAHRRATPVGGHVEVTAASPVTATSPRSADDRRLTFRVRATDDSGEIIAEGEMDRAIVDRARFLARHQRT
jgi:predicted thioesterase